MTKQKRERQPAPVPRYAIGDGAFVSDYGTKDERVTCPDCLGQKRVKVVLPSGEEFEADCQHCRRGWDSLGYVTVSRYAPRVWRGTVGSVQIDTNDENPVRYMLEETGVGTGRLHHEEDLFDDAPAAEAHAARKAKRQEEHIREQNEKQRKDKRIRELRFKERWERHARALCGAAEELLALLKLDDVEAELDQNAKTIRRLLGWIKPEEV